MIRWYEPARCAASLSPDGDPPVWQVILAGPFVDPPALLLDGTGRQWTDEEYAAAGAFQDRMLAAAFTRPVAGPDVAVVPAEDEDQQRHRYAPAVMTVWFH